MTIEQAKAYAWDCLRNIEAWRNSLQSAKNKIAELEQEQNQPKVETSTVDEPSEGNKPTEEKVAETQE